MGLFDPGPELVILIIMVALLIFGSTKLPELARGIGRSLGEFKRGKMEIEREIAQEFQESRPSQIEGAKNRIVEAARAFGLPVEGKSEEALKSGIQNAVKSEEDTSRVVTAAKALGIPVEGVGVDEIRSEITKTVTF